MQNTHEYESGLEKQTNKQTNKLKYVKIIKEIEIIIINNNN
jgi:hypothetical protein